MMTVREDRRETEVQKAISISLSDIFFFSFFELLFHSVEGESESERESDFGILCCLQGCLSLIS